MIYIFFIHGYGFPYRFLGIKYWGDIPLLLKSNDVKTFVVKVNSFGSMKQNGLIIADQVNQIYNDIDIKNIESYDNEIIFITHSKGGLDLLEGFNNFSDKVKSSTKKIVGLNTPIFGSTKAQKINTGYRISYKITIFFARLLSFILGDKNPDISQSLKDLADDHSDIFLNYFISNKIPFELYYSDIENNNLSFFWKIISRSYYPVQNHGDGIVDFSKIDELLDKAKNNKYFKIINYREIGYQKITHWSICGFPEFIKGKVDKQIDFYKRLVYGV